MQTFYVTLPVSSPISFAYRSLASRVERESAFNSLSRAEQNDLFAAMAHEMTPAEQSRFLKSIRATLRNRRVSRAKAAQS